MLHPSYAELMKVVNSEVEQGYIPVVNSRYSIVMATAKRARQIIAGEAAVSAQQASKPLSTAVDELNKGIIKILPEDEEVLEEIADEAAEEAVEAAETGEGEEGIQEA